MASIALTAPEEWFDDIRLDHLMGYFTYSQGFKGGGFNATINPSAGGNQLAPFEPETLDNFEIGMDVVSSQGPAHEVQHQPTCTQSSTRSVHPSTL